MEAKFEVLLDLGDLFCDNEDTIADVVKREIVSKVVREVKIRVEKQISDMLDVSIKETIDKHIGTIAREIMIKKFDENAEIKENNYNEKKIPVKELCSLYFAQALGRNNLEDKMKEYCKGIAVELRNRYDLQFAALIVNNLKQQNLLADDRLAELIK